jgi:hypothetical protein
MHRTAESGLRSQRTEGDAMRVLSSRKQRLVARGGAAVLAAASLAPLGRAAPAVAAGPGEIDGLVFEDFNQDGAKQSSEFGLAGITVTATAEDGTVTTTTTSATGTYTLTGLSGKYRVEFSGAPGSMVPSKQGAGNGTTVQFASAGATLNAAFTKPGDYCQSNPNIAATCFRMAPFSNPSLRVLPYNSTGTTPAGMVSRATLAQTGSTFGVAYHKPSKTIFQGAFLKRGVALGSGGIGAIYAVNASGTPASSLFTTIPGAGADGRPATPDWTRDIETYSRVFKNGLGDLDMSEDQKTLYAVNLATNAVHSIGINRDGTVGAAGAPMIVNSPSTCSASQFHIFGLGIDGTRGLIGGVCAGPTQADLVAYVFEFTASGTASGLNSTPVLSFPLTYTKGEAITWTGTTNDTGNSPWLAWDQVTSEADSDVQRATTAFPYAVSAPQPQVTDLVINDRGDLVIGIRDRFGDATGHGLFSSDSPTSTQFNEPAAAGDQLLACKTATGWDLEDDGVCGGRTGFSTTNNEGPGGGEFYNDGHTPCCHTEVSLGSLLRVPGKGEVIGSVYDPIVVNEQGLNHFSDLNGAQSGNTRLEIGSNAANGDMGKANGIGDLEALCDEGPLEIGNRVWLDRDGDGIQDPSDDGIDGVEVELYKGGVLVGQTTTANGGQYYFNTSNVNLGPAATVPGIVYGETDYEIRIPNATGASAQPELAKLMLTTANATGTGNDVRDSDAIADTTTPSTAVIAVPATAISQGGVSNHTFDAGFSPKYSLGNRVWLDNGAGGPASQANDGIQNGAEPGIGQVTVKLFAANSSGAPTGAVLDTQVTDANGYYRFDNLAPNDYVVVIDPTVPATATALAGLASSTGVSDPQNNTDRDDNGTDGTLGAGSVLPGGIASQVVKLGTDVSEPTNETDLPTGGSPDSARNEYSNQTVDFGFAPSYSLGNRVWFDTNNDGLINGSEVGIGNVAVTLLDAALNPIPGKTTTTDANGYYRFDGLPAGVYKVRIDASNFASGGVLENYASSTPTENVPDDDVDSNDNGLPPSPANGALTQGIRSNDITLGGATAEPTGETDRITTPGEAADNRSNLTVDFGFYRTVIGNTVWYDTNNDGDIDTGEPRIQGVVVNLVDVSTGTVIGTATTDSNGFYEISKTTTGAPLPTGVSVKIVIPAGQTVLGANQPSDPTGTADSFNHGVLVSGGNTESPAFTLTPGATSGGQTVDNPRGVTANPTLQLRPCVAWRPGVAGQQQQRPAGPG